MQKNSSIAGFKPSDSSEKVFTKHEGQNRITCYNCKQQGHRAAECPKRILFIENESDVTIAPADDPKETDTEEVYDILPEEDIDSLQVITDTPFHTEKKWLWENIFRWKGTVNGQECTIVTDGGRSQNIISQGLVDRLQLKVRKHYHPYFARRLMTGDEVQVRYACPITFSVGEDYTNTV